MICASCREGGAFNAHANETPNDLRLAFLKVAADHHKKCKDGTHCDCQHFVGQALNPQLVRQR